MLDEFKAWVAEHGLVALAIIYAGGILTGWVFHP